MMNEHDHRILRISKIKIWRSSFSLRCKHAKWERHLALLYIHNKKTNPFQTKRFYQTKQVSLLIVLRYEYSSSKISGVQTSDTKVISKKVEVKLAGSK